jgi:hypothetical protein
MLYAAKCYWPGVTHADLQHVADRAAATGTGPVTYLGCLLFTADDLVLCLFRGPSRAAVIAASDRLGLPRERLMDLAWLSPHQPNPEEPQQWPAT